MAGAVVTAAEGDAERVRRVFDLIEARGDVAGLHVLDLACRTGVFSTALADAGADVLGIEGRQENLEQCPPSSARYRLADVRDLSPEFGRFDITLCLGILYHLDAEDTMRLLAVMRQVTGWFAIIDTHVGADAGAAQVDGRTYRGWAFTESPDHPWASIGNPQSWWFTSTSLDEVIRDAGWSKVEHVPGPGWPGEASDRRWLVIS